MRNFRLSETVGKPNGIKNPLSRYFIALLTISEYDVRFERTTYT